MGDFQSELAARMRELRSELKLGLITQVEFEARAAEARDEWCPQFRQKRKPMPKARPWVPQQETKGLGEALQREFTIDPETGRVVALTPEAEKRMQARPDTSGKAQSASLKSKRFPSGAAIVLGFKRSGKLVNKLFTVGAACQDPYRIAARVAKRIVDRGGCAIYGYRVAGYETLDSQGNRPDFRELREAAQMGKGVPDFRLVASPDRKVGRKQVVGQSGSKGLILVDARTQYELTLQERLVWFMWFHCAGETKAAKRLAKFIRRPKTSKAELADAHKAAQVMAQEVPFHERKFVEHWAVGTTRRTDSSGRKVAVQVQVPIGCSALDCALPHTPDGTPFRVFWDDSREYTDYSVDSTDPEECLAHAQQLAMQTAGPTAVQHIRWTDEAGKHALTRGDAIRALYGSGDPYLDPNEDDRDGFAADLVAHLNPLEPGFQDHRVDRWHEANEEAERLQEALEATDKDTQEEEYQETALALAEAQSKRVKVARSLVPEHEQRTKMKNTSSKGKPHKWHARARNSKKGATWDRMKRAQSVVTWSRT